jgi:hypothetical protein
VKLAAPLILAAHASTLPTLDGWGADGDRPAVAVYEGAALRRDDVDQYVTVGYVAGADGPTLALEPVPSGQGQTREAGTVACQLIVGGPDVPTARARVFDLLEPWAQWLATDRTLGGVLLSSTDLHLSADVALATTRAGATANAVVTITYAATTYG